MNGMIWAISHSLCVCVSPAPSLFLPLSQNTHREHSDESHHEMVGNYEMKILFSDLIFVLFFTQNDDEHIWESQRERESKSWVANERTNIAFGYVSMFTCVCVCVFVCINIYICVLCVYGLLSMRIKKYCKQKPLVNAVRTRSTAKYKINIRNWFYFHIVLYYGNCSHLIWVGFVSFFFCCCFFHFVLFCLVCECVWLWVCMRCGV